MIGKKIFKFLDEEIKLRHGDRAKAARKIGMSKVMLHAVLNRLETDKGISTKTLEKICNGLDCDVVMVKRKSAK